MLLYNVSPKNQVIYEVNGIEYTVYNNPVFSILHDRSDW